MDANNVYPNVTPGASPDRSYHVSPSVRPERDVPRIFPDHSNRDAVGVHLDHGTSVTEFDSVAVGLDSGVTGRGTSSSGRGTGTAGQESSASRHDNTATGSRIVSAPHHFDVHGYSRMHVGRRVFDKEAKAAFIKKVFGSFDKGHKI